MTSTQHAFVAALFEHLLHHPYGELSLENFQELTGQVVPRYEGLIRFPEWGKTLIVIGADMAHKKVVYLQEYTE